MTERDDHRSDGFLVDGVAPPVIGGDESPGPDLDDDYADLRPQRVPQREEFRPGTRAEPPTTPIPAQGGPSVQDAAAQRKGGWLSRMFGRE